MEVRKMAEKRYTYTAKIKQPQTVAGVKLDLKSGVFSERQYKTLKKDAYGASLLEKGLLVVKEAQGDNVHETVPDFEACDASEDRPEDHAGWRPE
jgi:hypothetical protein